MDSGIQWLECSRGMWITGSKMSGYYIMDGGWLQSVTSSCVFVAFWLDWRTWCIHVWLVFCFRPGSSEAESESQICERSFWIDHSLNRGQTFFGGPLQFKLSKFHCSWFTYLYLEAIVESILWPRSDNIQDHFDWFDWIVPLYLICGQYENSALFGPSSRTHYTHHIRIADFGRNHLFFSVYL